MSSQQSRVFGPVVSRRLGMSLGVDLVPMKTCSFNCIYCQLGPTPRTTIERKRFSDIDEIVVEVSRVLSSRSDVDHITLSGSGEPTLEIAIAEIIHRLKGISRIPIAILTNGSMFSDAHVRQGVMDADAILPSLDAATEEVFQRINRPHQSIRLETLVLGLERLRDGYPGKIWLEVMLVRDVNDDELHVRKLAKLVERIRPDKVQLNTVVRPPAERDVEPLDQRDMETALRIFGPNAEIIADVAPERHRAGVMADKESVVLPLAKRRPVTIEEISAAATLLLPETVKLVEALERAGKLLRKVHDGKTFYVAANHPAR